METWNNLKTEPEKLSQKMSENKAKAAEFKSKSLRFWLKTSSAIPEKRSRNNEEAKTNTQGQQTCEDVNEKDEGMLSETNKKKTPIFNSISLIFLLLVCFNTNFLSTEREICTAKYRTEVFLCIQLLTEAIFVAFAFRRRML